MPVFNWVISYIKPAYICEPDLRATPVNLEVEFWERVISYSYLFLIDKKFIATVAVMPVVVFEKNAE